MSSLSKLSPTVMLASLALAHSSFAAVISNGAGAVQIAGGTNTDATEGPASAFDGTAKKYYTGGGGPLPTLVITPTAPSIVTSLRIFTANDEVVRDPTSFSLFGSLNGVNFFAIVENAAIALPTGRNGGNTPITDLNADSFASSTVSFSNSTAYTSYRFEVKSLSGGGTDAQFAELQLIGTAIPEPSAALLSLVGGMGLLAFRKRR